MENLINAISDLEILKNDMQVDIMILDLLEHSARVSKHDENTISDARSRTAAFLCNYSDELNFVFKEISRTVKEQKKILSSPSVPASFDGEENILNESNEEKIFSSSDKSCTGLKGEDFSFSSHLFLSGTGIPQF